MSGGRFLLLEGLEKCSKDGEGGAVGVFMYLAFAFHSRADDRVHPKGRV
jgi:hypothetical protein